MSGPETIGAVLARSPFQELRPYQETAVNAVIHEWRTGIRRVLLVSPTGSGKTRMSEELIAYARERQASVLFVAHRRELIQQTAERLRSRFGQFQISTIAPGAEYNPHCAIQVASVQTLVAREQRPEAKLLVLDEAHHFSSDEWSAVARHYAESKVVGLTATPERQDGRPLGDIFQALVVAAKYTDLVRDGHLVQCRVYQPPEIMGSDLAQDPLVAYQRYGEGARAFVFCASVEAAYTLAERFRQAAIPADTIEANTPKDKRDEILAKFAAGKISALMNVYALTEGVDIPAARVCILARGCGHVGMYLQIAGRVLRPAPGKPDAILIDLSGATLMHGLPTEDREYSLEGKGIRRTSVGGLKNCPQCGATIESAVTVCPECNFAFPAAKRSEPRIYDHELRAVYAGADTPSTAKEREYKRLRALQQARGMSLYFVQKSFKDLFGVLPVIVDATEEEKRAELAKLQATAQARGFKPGFVKIRYKETFGHWPRTGS